ncbi:unnamed protein product [Fraxinus pennsylvanica]|uniref:Polymerase nucleotidyl transferase domain-containing protein n=1 Tax=Fraxinus pennsylvanica TaxID=56036 RepID=A0AAD2DQZ9_9LAMI|nr:unnamed protein product [Fraxinus pennsylvanica]
MSLSDSEAVDQNTGDMAEDGRMIPGYGLFRNPFRDLRTINVECWVIVEVVAQKVLNIVHPTLGSEKKRKEIIDCISRLFDSILNDKVFPYGLVPLKTYLHHGDIDFTIIKSPNVEESLAHDILALLNRKEQSGNSEYEVKNTGLIDVEVCMKLRIPNWSMLR